MKIEMEKTNKTIEDQDIQRRVLEAALVKKDLAAALLQLEAQRIAAQSVSRNTAHSRCSCLLTAYFDCAVVNPSIVQALFAAGEQQ